MGGELTNREIPSSRLSPFEVITSKAPNSPGTRRGVDSGSNQQRDTRNCCDLRKLDAVDLVPSPALGTWETEMPVSQDKTRRDFIQRCSMDRVDIEPDRFSTKGAVLYLIYMRI